MRTSVSTSLRNSLSPHSSSSVLVSPQPTVLLDQSSYMKYKSLSQSLQDLSQTTQNYSYCVPLGESFCLCGWRPTTGCIKNIAKEKGVITVGFDECPSLTDLEICGYFENSTYAILWPALATHTVSPISGFHPWARMGEILAHLYCWAFRMRIEKCWYQVFEIINKVIGFNFKIQYLL